MRRRLALLVVAGTWLIGCELLSGIDELELVPCEAGRCGPGRDGGVGSTDALGDSPSTRDAPSGRDVDEVDPPPGPECIQTLANVGLDDFTIRFRIRTTETVNRAVLCQRSPCSGPGYDVSMQATGRLHFGAAGTDLLNYVAINDGTPHDVVIRRTASTLTITVDGADAVSAPSTTDFGAIPPLAVRIGCPCLPDAWTATITRVCITRP